MRWRDRLLAGGAAVGVAAVVNALISRSAGPLANAIGGEERWYDWRGRRIFYTRHGAARGARGAGLPLVLVHGLHAAASSFEWRSNVEALSAAHPVYALDLLGFGLSDRPNMRYSGGLYTRLIDDFVRAVVRGPCVLVASSLSGAYAAMLAARAPARYRAVVLIEPAGVMRLNEHVEVTGDVARVVLDAPVVGTAFFNGVVSRKSLRYYLRRAYTDRRRVTEELVEAYYAAAHQPGARHAPAAFLAGHLNVDARGAVRRLAQPLLLVWGRQAVDTPVEDVVGFRTLKPDLELAIIDSAGMLPHDERAAEFNGLVLEFLARVDRGAAAAGAETGEEASKEVIEEVSEETGEEPIEEPDAEPVDEAAAEEDEADERAGAPRDAAR